jgi:hypothetical protein
MLTHAAVKGVLDFVRGEGYFSEESIKQRQMEKILKILEEQYKEVLIQESLKNSGNDLQQELVGDTDKLEDLAA